MPCSSPISIKQVWDQIKGSGLRPHAAYSWGLARPCSLCVLGSMDDLLLAVALRSQLAADYHQAEMELGHRVTHKLSMGEILAGLRAARLEAAGDAKVVPWQMARDHIAAARAQAVLDKDVKP
ncbi:hypothetical protein [Nonomuraea turcica]|uniref:hypothetical protein n=1 Tax=Nonomuraea sp. G32 TaxID=3067274 RepID=UPI00273B3618|nr:hypothetical protein [Nonomuraea sp. G32]MDP4510341.1 hypothetical protein [Nonomuraea sp. G32]